MGKEENRKKMELQAQSVVRTAGEQLQVPLAAAEDPAERHLELGVLHRKAAQVTPYGVSTAEAVVGVCLESRLPEEVHILQRLAAAHEDGREILYDVGIGIPRVYPLGPQCVVSQCGKSG